MKYTILGILIACASVVQAQSFRFGASVAPAVNFWIVEGDNYLPADNKFGFQLGGELDYAIGETGRFAIASGLRFTSVPGGFEQNPTSQSYAGKYWDFKTTTLDLPIMVRLRSNEMGKSVIFLQYGVTMGFTLSSSVVLNDGKGGGEDYEYQSSNTSLTMGAGLEYNMNDHMTLMFTTFFQNGVKNMVVYTKNDDSDSRYFPQQIGLRASVLF
ncbi:MAG TPA: outer membrane beta-barrel protein [Chitinophagales bacterium]|nr:outer membrane beta-barrel protein [Chitinophagales bacterium]